MFNMHYYKKEALRRKVILGLMFVILVINLFPIFWMVFCSFKNNRDILSGNVGFSRARTDILKMAIDNDDLIMLSMDGSINKLNLKSNESINKVTVKGQDVNLSIDDQFYYLSNSNKGIFKIDKNTLRVVDKVEVILKGVDSNKLGPTSIASDGNVIYYAIEYKGDRRLYVYDKQDLSLLKTIELNIDKNDYIRSLQIFEGSLYVGTNKELLLFDKESLMITLRVSLGEDYYPIGTQKIIGRVGDTLLYLTQKAIKFIDPHNQEILNESSYQLGIMEDAYIKDNLLFIAHDNGLAVIDIVNNKRLSNQESLIQPLFENFRVDLSSSFDVSELTSILPYGKQILLGSTYGRGSMVVFGEKIPYRSFQLADGYRLVKWKNYVDLWKNIDFGLYLRNSVIISGFTMFFAMIFATMTAYALVRFNFPGNKGFGISILATQMIPGIMYLIPLFSMFKWVTDVTGVPVKGTYGGLIFIYTAFFVPFSIWILRSFFSAIPRELEESARIDGCNAFQVFYKIALPLAVPGIIATGIYIFLQAWDELMFAWVLTSADTMTIPIGIRLFVGNFQNRYDLMMAAATVATVPVLILFFLLQKHIVKGLTAGAVKG
jgi:multiple sugar transport system permease protein